MTGPLKVTTTSQSIANAAPNSDTTANNDQLRLIMSEQTILQSFTAQYHTLYVHVKRLNKITTSMLIQVYRTNITQILLEHKQNKRTRNTYIYT